jgi:hypothetical protein
LQVGDGLNSRNFKTLAATDIFTAQHVIATNHVTARLRKAGTVDLIGSTRHLRPLAAYQPAQFVLTRLTAMRTVQGVSLDLCPLFIKLALIHLQPPRLKQNTLPELCEGSLRVTLSRGAVDGKSEEKDLLHHEGHQAQRSGTAWHKEKAAAKPKHKETLSDLLSKTDIDA